VLGADSQSVPIGKTSLGTIVEVFGYRWGTEDYSMRGEVQRAGYVPGGGHLHTVRTGLAEGNSVAGMSGGPIFDPQRMLVVGIQHGEEIRSGGLCYVHLIEHAYRNWGALKEQNPPISKLFNRSRLQHSIEQSIFLKRRLQLLEQRDVPESTAVRRDFHKITALRWKYIEAKADSARDLYHEILSEVGDGKAGFRFYSILGEPLSGKSTLLRRLGYDLACKGGLVLYVLEPKDADLWNQVVEFTDLVDETIYVLLDDILDDREAFNAFDKFAIVAAEEGLSIAVIVSSLRNRTVQKNLEHLSRAGVPILSRHLELTDGDKSEILRNLKIDPLSVDTQSFGQLMAIPRLYPFLVQIREVLEHASLGAGELIPAEALEERRLGRLLDQQARLHAAYKYVAFVHRHNITLPLSVFQKLENGKFADALHLEGCSDWIFEPEDQDQNYPAIQTAHWALASTH